MTNYLEQFIQDYLNGFHLPLLIALFFFVLIIVLIIYILIYQRLTRDTEAKFKRWDFIADHIIRDAIFFEEGSGNGNQQDALSILEADKLNIPERLRKLLKRDKFRFRLMKKILLAKSNVSGEAGENLTKLYRQLELDKGLSRMLKSRSWYINAMAIQAIGVLDLREFKEYVLSFINHKRGLIRVESQNVIVKFDGFDGLRFLDDATYPITEWQQIKLLDELSHSSNEHFSGIDIWLRSKNDTVVIFALKLVRTYHQFELYDHVLKCLEHENQEVRRQAILVLKQLPSPQTAPVLIERYPLETERNRILILHVMSYVCSTDDLPFLVSLLEDKSNEVKVNAAKAIASLGQEGINILDGHKDIDNEPLKVIVAQIKEELR